MTMVKRITRIFAFAAALVATTVWAQAPPPPIVPTAPPGTNDNQVASTAFVQQAVAANTGGLIIGSTLIALGTNNGVLYDNVGVLGILPGTSGGIAYFNATNAAASSALLSLNGIVIGGGAGTAPHILAGTSGGIPYFNATNTAASSAALAANGIVVGGGAGATPRTSPCTIDTNPVVICASSLSTFPQYTLQNNTNDTSFPAFNAAKFKTPNTNSNDSLGDFQFLGFASIQRTAAQLLVKQNGASSGSFVPADLFLYSSSTLGLLNDIMIFDHSAHFSFSGFTPGVVCGTAGSVLPNTNDIIGTIQGPATSQGSCIITFAIAYNNPPHCTVNTWNGSAATISTTTTALTVTFTPVVSPKLSYRCIGS